MGAVRTAGAVAATFVLVACARSPQAAIDFNAPSTTIPAPTSTVATIPTTIATTTSTTAATLPATTSPPTTKSPPTTPATTVPGTVQPVFESSLSTPTAGDLPSSWRSGCPVGPDELRMLRLSYWGFDDRPHTGTLVVRATVATDIAGVFRRLYDARFPIRRMEPIDAYGGSDDASIAADNTSAFNCRNAVSNGPPAWSMHAYGEAIDVNPVENPYLLDGAVLPPAGAAYLDRSTYQPGMAVTGGTLVNAFAAAGWQWGGVWSAPDYQHFSTNGR